SRFELGIDANMRMGRFLRRLEQLEQDLRSREPHPLVGPPSLHAATLSGGTALSMYAAHCSLGVERRTVPGETEGMVMAELQQIIDRLAAEDETFEATMELILARDPFEVAPDEDIVLAVSDAGEEVLGQAPAQVGDTPWMDSALLAAAGVETVVMGPHGAGAHAAEEWVSLQSLDELAQILASAAMRYCGVAGS
ncbi:MAG: M20/M25/M40 family metallo-hydrolase, partial [Chloroflexota bacterium]